MSYTFAPAERHCWPSHVCWTGQDALLSPLECRHLIAVGNGTTLVAGTVGNATTHGSRKDLEYRSVQTRALWPAADDVQWLYDRLGQKIADANAHGFGLDLTSIREGIQFLRYDCNEEHPGHYKLHQDFGGGVSSTRKLSLVVQLSDPEDYDGCELELVTNSIFSPEAKGIGEGVLFPSFTAHRVTAITRGTRYSLAVWVSGPPLR